MEGIFTQDPAFRKGKEFESEVRLKHEYWACEPGQTEKKSKLQSPEVERFESFSYLLVTLLSVSADIRFQS